MKKSMHFGLLITVLGLTSCNFLGSSENNAENSNDGSSFNQTSSINKYSVTWVDWDGEVLEIDNGVLEGETPSYDGEIPFREKDDYYIYSFNGWSPEVKPIYSNCIYFAQYDKHERDGYTVFWQDSSGHNLQIDEDFFGTEYTFDGDIPTVLVDETSCRPMIEWSHFQDDLTRVVIKKAVISADSSLNFVLNDDGSSYSISSYLVGEEENAELYLPNVFNGLPVTGVLSGAFSSIVSVDSLENIYVPESITTIADDAFPEKYLTFFFETANETSELDFSCYSLGYGGLPYYQKVFGYVNQKGRIGNLEYAAIRNQNGEKSITVYGITPLNLTESRTGIELLAIPDSIAVDEIDLPVKNIGEGCSRCPIVNLVIGKNVEVISEFAFMYSCIYLRTIEFASDGSLISIESYAFYGSSLQGNVNFPSSLRFIGALAFYSSNFDSLVFGDSIEEIGANAFSDNDDLTEVAFSDLSKIQSLESYIFSDCASLTSISLPPSIEEIGDNAFSGCNSLQDIVFADGTSIQSLGAEAFFGTSSLKELSIPGELIYVGYRPFFNSGIENLYLEMDYSSNIERRLYEENSSFAIHWNYNQEKSVVEIGDYVLLVYEKEDGTLSCSILSYNGEATELVLPRVFLFDGNEVAVEGISYGAFRNNSSIEKISVESGSSLKYIAGGAFDQCGKLKKVDLTNAAGLKEIGYRAFSDLSWIILPTNIETIQTSAFYNCIIYLYLDEIPNSWPEGWCADSTYFLANAWEIVNGEPSPIYPMAN